MTNDEITKYIFLEESETKSDLAFVFGTWFAFNESVGKAVELYERGLVSKVLFTGGRNKHSGTIEGETMAEEAIQLGVPRESVLIENSATNTLENVLFSLPIIDKELGFENIKSITAIAKEHHIRRALMTLRKHLPLHIELKVATYKAINYPFTKDNWADSEKGKEDVLQEVEKIKIYLAKGDLVELTK